MDEQKIKENEQKMKKARKDANRENFRNGCLSFFVIAIVLYLLFRLSLWILKKG